eukprot:14088518-Alexandrium_andersonii.AAC.1
MLRRQVLPARVGRGKAPATTWGPAQPGQHGDLVAGDGPRRSPSHGGGSIDRPEEQQADAH